MVEQFVFYTHSLQLFIQAGFLWTHETMGWIGKEIEEPVFKRKMIATSSHQFSRHCDRWRLMNHSKGRRWSTSAQRISLSVAKTNETSSNTTKASNTAATTAATCGTAAAAATGSTCCPAGSHHFGDRKRCCAQCRVDTSLLLNLPSLSQPIQSTMFVKCGEKGYTSEAETKNEPCIDKGEANRYNSCKIGPSG